MKRFIAVLCAAVMTVATCVTPFAAISGKEPAAIQSDSVVVDTASEFTDQAVADAIAEKAAAGITVVCVEVKPEDFQEGTLERAIAEVFASKDGTTAKAFDAGKVTDDTVTSTDNNKFSKSKLVVASKFMCLRFSDGTSLPAGKIRVTMKLPETLKGKNLLIMQVDPEKQTVYFVEVKVENGNVIANLPCTGPFLFLEVKA